jgi:hypothetical protein
LPKAIFEKNVTRFAKFAWVMHESCEFGVSGHSLIISLIFVTFWFPFIFLLLYSFNHFNHFR